MQDGLDISAGQPTIPSQQARQKWQHERRRVGSTQGQRKFRLAVHRAYGFSACYFIGETNQNKHCFVCGQSRMQPRCMLHATTQLIHENGKSLLRLLVTLF